MDYISGLSDEQLCKLIDNRWLSSDSVWSTVESVYNENTKAYQNVPEWLGRLPKKKSRVRANRIFINTEAVINSIIANPPKPNIIPGRDTPVSKKLAVTQEKYFQIKYNDRNVKEVLRKGLRNLYFSRLIVLKPFWNSDLNDFDVIAVDSRKVRFSKHSTKEDDSEFAIEEVTDNIIAIITKFPEKKAEILKHCGITDEKDLYVENKDITYKEAWCGDYIICKLANIILDKKRNPYWDWEGYSMSHENKKALNNAENVELRRALMGAIKSSGEKDGPAYFYNHFDKPRKPYIFATIFNNENTPIGTTDFITQAIPLQEDIDETKRNITENAKIVNGIIKVDAKVMSKVDATRLSWETGGLIWGPGVQNGVTREMGTPLPNFVMENLKDSRAEIDDIMASAAAFRGIREGQETRGGRLALIDQSFLRLNELVQVIDYVNNELFNWFYQLAKVNYTEHHYAKSLGVDRATEIMTIMQDDFEDGTEVRVIAGKTLPEDRQFKYEQAQKDLELGVLSPVDYLQTAGYDTPAEKARNKVIYDINKPFAVGISQEELAEIVPPPSVMPEAPKTSIKYEDLPPDGQLQLAAKAGLTLNPQMVTAEALHKKQNSDTMKKERPPMAST